MTSLTAKNKVSPRILLLVVLAAIAPFALLRSNEDAQAEGYTSPIATTALKYVGTHGGQCWTFMKQVVAEATGAQIGYDYRLGFFEAGAWEVSANEARSGDIIQIASDANTLPWASYPGLHTAIILENLGGGVFNAVDSNQNWDEMVRLRPNYNPYASAARYGLQVHIYRIPDGSGGGNGASAAAAPTPTEPSAWAAGDGGVVAAGSDCLNLRTAPSLDADRIACLRSGVGVTAVSGPTEADGYTWVQVETPAGTGWVAAEYLSLTSPAAGEAPAAPAAAEQSGPLTARTDNSPGCLRLRSSGSLSGGILDCLGAGTVVTLVDGSTVPADGYNWVQVTVNGKTGWVANEYLVR
ncbi:MAG: SH3 domain-containing protein [Hyphomicrobiales bacterium]